MKNISVITFLLLLINFNAFNQTIVESKLKEAIQKNNFDVLENVLDAYNGDSSHQGNSLLLAIEYNSPKAVEFILKRGADTNFTFRSRSPLMYAIQKQNPAVVKLLIKHGAAINKKDSLGNTALMIAATGKKLRILKILIRNGASLNVRNKKGLTARDFAVRSNNKVAAGYLRNVFERNLPDYFDGPYVSLKKKRIKITYLQHDSLRRRSESIDQFEKLRDLNGQFTSFAGEKYCYPFPDKFERPASELKNVEKLLIIGDVHGQYDTLRLFLQNNNVIDQNLHWSFGKGTVVFLGDIFDRGEKVTEALWLIYRLEKEASDQGGTLQLLRGNHEMMIMQDDQRYVGEKYFYLFKNLKYNYSKFYGSKTLLGRWLRSRNTFLKVDSMLFVHGGIHPDMLKYKFTLDSVNNLVNRYLLSKRKIEFSNNYLLQFLLSYNGPYWYRGMVEQSDVNCISINEVERILSEFNVKHIIVGHTFRPEIKNFFHGKVISTDVPFYLPDGQPMQALLLENAKFVILNSKGERKDFNLQ